MSAPRSDGSSRRHHPPGYAWRLEEGALCFWAEPSKDALVKRRKPSPGAVATRVRIVPIDDYKAMLAAWRREEKQ